ncbi:hypothetical protein MN608_03844 [Microdochium nivale]|nr:hypothetical protein MN608_03844 [Microdochium nivale]
MSSPILDLPLDIIFLLPAYFDDIRTLLRLQQTCRPLYSALEQTLPNTILHLVVRSSGAGQLLQACRRTRPLAHVLALAVARQVADWAAGDGSRTARLRHAFAAGSRGILELGLDVAGLTLAEVTELCCLDGKSRRKGMVRPPRSHQVSSALDRMVACIMQCHSGDQEDRVTLRETGMAADMVYHMAIYGELFRPSVTLGVDQYTARHRFATEVRQAYIAEWPALSEATSSSLLTSTLKGCPATRGTSSSPHKRKDGPGEEGNSADRRRAPRAAGEDTEGRRGQGAMTLGAILRDELLSLSDNKAWQMKWRTALHTAGMLSSRSSAAEDRFWITAMQSCGLAGADLWSWLVSSRPTTASADDGNLGLPTMRARWAGERRGFVQGARIAGVMDWPDFWSDLRAVAGKA